MTNPMPTPQYGPTGAGAVPPGGYAPRGGANLAAPAQGAPASFTAPTGEGWSGRSLSAAEKTTQGALLALKAEIGKAVVGQDGAITGLIVALVAAARRRPTLAGRALGAVVGANIATQVLKDYILTRPNLGVTTGAGNSLPSGHTTVAVTLSLALIVVAPQWFRSPAAWIGWAWTSLMGVSVMMEGWHRPSDVITAALIAGAWALALSPIERRPRHGASIQRAMVWVCLGLLGVAVLATLAAMWGFSMSAASPGSGYGFEHFLLIRPWRSRVLGVAAIAWVSGICGLIIHEVDRLAGE